MLLPRSAIILCDDVDEAVADITHKLQDKRVVTFVKEKFLVEDAKEVIAEAYISEAEAKYILIGAKEYNIYSQNALLKILEEPPKNIIFYLFSPSKSALLPTIRSRLAIQNLKSKKEKVDLGIDLIRLDLETIYKFIQTYKDIPRMEAKELIEALLQTALHQGVTLSQKQLDNFELAYKLVDLNTRISHILSLLLMGFLYENKNTL